ncbi:pentapeptide repeat-containing protein, partial [Planococcus sp. SIMBA_160]
NFTSAKLNKINFHGSSLFHSILKKAILSRIECQQVDLQEANFQGSQLFDVDFTNSSLVGTYFEGASLEKVSFKDSN